MSSTATTQTNSQHEGSRYGQWLVIQSLPVAAAVETVKGALIGAAYGFTQGRNFGAMMGAFNGTLSIMGRIRGEEDIQSRMVSAFVAGAVFILV